MEEGVQKKDFHFEEALSTGWIAMKQHFWLFLGCLIVAWVVIAVPRGIGQALSKENAGLGGVFIILSALIQVVISVGFIRIVLKILDGEKPEFMDLFTFPQFFIEYLAASILTGLLVTAGFFLLIVPGIYWAIKFQFFGYCVVDRKLNPIEAMRQSARITKTVKWKLFGFGIVIALINILGVICLVVGLFVTIPLTMVAYAFVYRNLLSQSDLVETTEIEPQIEKKEVEPEPESKTRKSAKAKKKKT